VLPALLMVLGVFVSFIQTFVFILLSQLYLSEVSHPPHDEHEEHGEHGGEHVHGSATDDLAPATT
jgi:hypothetical protein